MDMPLLEADGATVMDDEQKVVFANFSYTLVSWSERMSSRLRRIRRSKAPGEQS